MPRDGVTQTRAFTYDTTTQSRLLSATNPENGTVSYTSNADAKTATKTDARGWNWMLNASNVEVPCAVAGGFTDSYSYNAAGRILSKNLTLTKSSNGNTGSASLAASWIHNNEAQVTNVTYPNRFKGLFQSQRQVTHGYVSTLT